MGSTAQSDGPPPTSAAELASDPAAAPDRGIFETVIGSLLNFFLG